MRETVALVEPEDVARAPVEPYLHGVDIVKTDVGPERHDERSPVDLRGLRIPFGLRRAVGREVGRSDWCLRGFRSHGFKESRWRGC